MTPKDTRPTRRYPGTSHAERLRLRREDLLETGIELLASGGVTGLRVRDVCAHTGLTERFFYEAFGSLDVFTREVFLLAALRTSGPVLAVTQQQPDPRARAREGLRTLIDTLAADPRLARILFLETTRAGGDLAALRDRMLTGGAAVIRLWLDGGAALADENLVDLGLEVLADATKTSPLERDLDPGVFLLSGATAELIVAWIDGRTSADADEIVEQLIALFDFVAARRPGHG